MGQKLKLHVEFYSEAVVFWDVPTDAEQLFIFLWHVGSTYFMNLTSNLPQSLQFIYQLCCLPEPERREF